MVKQMMCVSAIGALGITGVASAQVATFAYSDLSGDYNSATSTFIAAGRALSTGDFTREGFGTAAFNEGLLKGNGTPSIRVEMTVENIDAVNFTATGTGNIRIVDADGDEFTGTFDGVWIGSDLGFTFASSTGVDFSFDSSNGDGTFDGSTSGSWLGFDDNDIFAGAVSMLFLQQSTKNFFQSDFRIADTSVDGQIIPAPAGVGVLAGLGLVAARRRRA